MDELLIKALDALEKEQPALLIKKPGTRAEAAAHIREARKGKRLPEGVTIRDLIDEGRA